MDKIDKIKERAKSKIELLSIKNDINIEKLNLDNKLLNAQSETLNIKYDNILLQNKAGLFDRLRMSGRILSLLGLFSFIVSTILSLISGYRIIKSIVLFIGFALIMTVCQMIIFISSKYNTITKDQFTHRYVGLKTMQLSMLFVSLTLNIMFINECFNSLLLDIIMFPLCFVIDYSTIFFNGMGYDFKTLTFNISSKKITLFEKLLDNIFFRIKTWIENTYNKNHDIKINEINNNIVKTNEVKKLEAVKTDEIVKNEIVKTNIVKLDKIKTNRVKTNKVKTIGFSLDPDGDGLSEKLSQYLDSIYRNGDMVKTKELRSKFNLSESGWKKVKKSLPVESKGTKLFYKGN